MIHRFFYQPKYLLALCFTARMLCLHAQEPTRILPDTLPHTDSLAYDQLRAIGAKLHAQAGILTDFYGKKAVARQEARAEAEARLIPAKQDTTLGKDSLKTLQTVFKKSQKQEKEALRVLKKAEITAKLAKKLAETQDTTALRLQIPKVFREIQKIMPRNQSEKPEKPLAAILGPISIHDNAPSKNEQEQAPSPAAEPDSTTQTTEKKLKKNRKQTPAPPDNPIHRYDPKTDVLRNPPTPPCRLAVEQRDAFSGERYRETAPEELFRFTNPIMKKVLEDKTHIRCDATLTATGPQVALRLQFTINDPNPRSTFGGLPQGSIAVLKFMDGTTHTLYNLKADTGAPDERSGAYMFTGLHPLDPATQKKIAARELDKLRIAWMTGYEDYEIYRVDVLLRLLPCLLAPKP
ncbi:MAG: hypothetical protein ACR2K1_06500 [Saprospiraceae bacterium]